MTEMAQRIKLSSLKVPQLNSLLQSQNIKKSGDKNAKVQVLTELYGSEEIDAEELEVCEQNNLLPQIKTMNDMMHALATSVQSLTDGSKVMAEQLAGLQTSRRNEINGNYGVSPQGPSRSLSLETARPNEEFSEAQAENGETPQGQMGQSPEALQSGNDSGRGRQWSIKEVTGVLPEYDPLKKTITSQQFLAKAELLQRAYKWSEEILLISVQHQLRGAAKLWVDAQQVFMTWAEFAYAFRRDFPTTENSADYHREMMRQRKKPHQTLLEYYYAMLAIGRRGNLDEKAIVSYVIEGINDPALVKSLLAQNIQTCVGLVAVLENLMTSQPSTQRTVNDSQQDRPRTTGEGHQNRQSATRGTEGPKCFNCNLRGHLAVNCPQPQRKQRCDKCKKIGHSANACRSERDTVAKLETTGPANRNVGYTPPVMETISIWGRRCDAFIDTGSDSSLIAQTLVPPEVTRKAVERRLKGFGGAVTDVKHSVEVEIDFKKVHIKVELLVVPAEIMPYDLLIGRDVICQSGCQLVISSGVTKVCTIKEEQLNVSREVESTERQRIMNLLSSYDDCFAEDMSRLGRCKTAEMTIKVKTDQPVVGKRYTVALAQRPVLSAIVENLERYGIIRPSTSPHAAPVVLVKKSNGEDRMCVDYRALNAVTEKKHFPMPIVEEQLAKLAGKKFYTTLDMTAGYYQVPIAEESKKYTAFITPDGLYEHNVMPFGLVNAPMVFQEMITDIIKKLKNKAYIISYVDEVILVAETVDDGVQILDEFLDAIRGAGLTLRPSKCVFMAKKVQFLGHVISQDGIQPGDEKTRCVAEFPRPRNATEMRQFLGLTGFFRKFIANYGAIAKPLTELLRKNAPYLWNDDHEKAFDTLKRTLTEKPLLAIYHPEREHEVHTDASSVGLSGVMMQLEDGKLKPVHYFSRQCSAVESTYPSHELEVLAIVEALERMRVYLLGTRFTVVTDCNAIATTKATTLLKARIARWWLRLQEFDFTCKHRPGCSMQHVDTLSRAPVEAERVSSTVADQVLSVAQEQETRDWVYNMQMQDSKLQTIFAILKGTSSGDNAIEAQVRTDYELCDNRLYRKTGGQSRLVVPRAVRWRVTKSCHDDVGHFALEKTIQRIQRHFWFPRMRRYVKSYIASCEECCVNKVKGGQAESRLHIREVLPIPFRHLYLDHMGPFIRSKRGNTHLLVMVCGFSKFVILKPTRTTKTEPVIKALQETMAIFGQPLRLTTDRGTAFTSNQFLDFVNRYGIRHEKTAVRTSRANGQAERANKTVLVALRCLVKDNKDWDTHLNTIQWSLNSQRNDVTKCSPNELVFFYSLREVILNRLIQVLHEDESRPLEIDTRCNMAAENIRQSRRKWKERYDRSHRRPQTYSVGDLVLIDNIPTATGQSKKLEPPFKGPYIITKTLDYDRYIVENLPDAEKGGRPYASVHSADHLKPWCVLSPELDDDEADGDSSGEDEASGTAEL